MPPAPLILASRSPRRAELLRLLGVDFRVVDVAVDEDGHAGEAPADYVLRVARAKAAAGAAAAPGMALLAADTTVARAGRIFGKPRDADDASAMLLALAGGWHEVYTAVVVRAADARHLERVVCTRVEFVPFDAAVAAAYWASGEPADKAGAYGIQGLGGALVARIDGSYSAVVGLPLAETAALLTAAGVGHALTGIAPRPSS